MLRAGQPLPDVVVWDVDRSTVSLRDLGRGDAILLVFYLFDWSGT